MASPFPQLFGILPTGLPPITTPTAAPTTTSFLFTLPPLTARAYSHIAVFILPGITLPPDSAAAVYIQLPSASAQGSNGNSNTPAFKFLGGIGPGKESAIFKISGLVGSASGSSSAEVDMDAASSASPSLSSAGGEITLGISLEPAASVSAQIAALQSSSQAQSSPQSSSALVLAGRSAAPPRTEQEVKVALAQKIIQNAFNFLASFSGNLQNGVEVVPLKAFEEWWKKFEGRVRSDPMFLERGGEGD